MSRSVRMQMVPWSPQVHTNTNRGTVACYGTSGSVQDSLHSFYNLYVTIQLCSGSAAVHFAFCAVHLLVCCTTVAATNSALQTMP